jgi:hypothetical protein
MHERRVLLLFAALLAISLGLIGKRAHAATPSFTLTASNATMSASGSSSVPFTVTSVNGYAGTVHVSCNPVNIPSGAKLPYCGLSIAVPTYTVPANGTVTGNLSLLASPIPCAPSGCPVKLDRPHKGFATGLALAGALLVGFGFIRRKGHLFTLMLFAAGSLAVMAGINACGGSSGSTLTAGVWPYTVTSSDTSTNETVSTTVNVTVPAGIAGIGMD